MNMDIKEVITGTLVLIGIFLVVSKANDVGTLVKAIGGVATAQTKQLQGN